MSVLKETIKFYKERKAYEKEKNLVLNSEMNLQFLENFIQKINCNPNLVVNFILKDGTKVELCTYSKKVRRDYQLINGASDSEEIFIK